MFEIPVKRIVTKEDLDEFLQSDAYNEYIEYITRLNDSVCDLKIDPNMEVSSVRSSLLFYIYIYISIYKLT